MGTTGCVWALARRAVAFATLAVALAAPARAAADGLDESFGDHGLTVLDAGGSEYGTGMALTADGKIILVGESSSQVGLGRSVKIARLTATGQPDLTFGASGIRTLTYPDAGSWTDATDVAVMPDGKLAITGYYEPAGDDTDQRTYVARLTSAGEPDPTFAGDGFATADELPGVPSDDWPDAVAVARDGKLLVAGARNDGMYVARLNADGHLDASFSTDGIADAIIPGYRARTSALVATAAGGAVIAGAEKTTSGPLHQYYGVARVDADGRLDPTFGTAGATVIQAEVADEPPAMDVTADGKVLLAAEGHVATPTPCNTAATIRLTSSGSLDPTFGDGGFIQPCNPPGISTPAFAVAARPDGTVVVGGGIVDIPAFWQYKINGELDLAFGTDGVAAVPGQGYVRDLLVQPDGKPIASGYWHPDEDGGEGDLFAARQTDPLGASIADTDAPDTVITAGPQNGATVTGTVSFEFAPGEAGGGYECRVDGGDWTACSSPRSVTLPAGAHTFEVRQYDAAGNRDLTPAARSFTVAEPPSTSPGPPPPAPGPVTDRTAPTLRWASSKPVKLAAQLKLAFACPDEACKVTATTKLKLPRSGKSKARTFTLRAATTLARAGNGTLRFKLPAAAVRGARAALIAHKKLQLTISVSVADAAGNTRKLTHVLALRR